MSTHNIGFKKKQTKIIFQLSPNIIKYAPYLFFCLCILDSKDLSFLKDNSKDFPDRVDAQADLISHFAQMPHYWFS